MIVPKKKFMSFKKRTALFLTVIMLFETIFPSVSLALTSGPSTPEFSSFEPVATTNMVNEFSGDFTYNIPVINIPGADGGGYALSLSYHSGESLESESSWVGYGWTLNPGAINRSKRGFADDTKATHTFVNDVPKNWTASVGTSVGDPELFSTDIPVSLNAGLRYNNYKGFGYTAGVGLSVKGIMSLGYSVSDGSGSFSAQINPGALLKAIKDKKAKNKKEKELKEEGLTKLDKKAINDKYVAAVNKKAKGQTAGSLIGSALSGYGMHTFGDLEMPTSITPYNGNSYNVSVNVDLNPGPVPIGLTMGLSGNYTQQKNVPTVDRIGYGYLYSNDAYTNPEGMMDYYNEKESTFNKRDQYMSIPFSNADMYSVTGEGLSGGFRLHNINVGRLRPNAMESKTEIRQAGGEISVGLDFGAGVDVGVGLQTLSCFGDKWGIGTSSANAFTQYNFTNRNEKENYFFRFSNDLGGDVSYGSDALVTALVNSKTPDLTTATTSGLNSQYNALSSTIDNSGSTVARSGRSSYIGYNTYSDVRTTSNGKRTLAYDNSYKTNFYRPASGKDEQIAEIATVNEEGNTYVYGLTANSKNEKNISYSMDGASIVTNRFNALKNVNGTNKMKVGTETASEYATTYMLTQITTPDYVDRTLNGPSDDDFGGYTKFVYKKNPSDYHWRMPYTGFNYSKGNLSNQDDDMGSFSSGDKEIYYLDTIITKTHLAIFYKSLRNDGYAAASDMSAASNVSAKGPQQLQKLDSICLFTNNNGLPGKRIKKTCFKYDYTLCQGVPNSISAATGKLTLTSVWFEYEGIVNAKISPYKFSYSYANPLTSYPFPYSTAGNPNQFNDYASIIATGNQNPNYGICDIDAWGNYQKNGYLRYNNEQLNVTQKPDADFDPAAWQLKRITLPSGGEIHVQYEQDDYQYVQNRRAMALVPLSSGGGGEISSFSLDINSSLGYTPSETAELADLINNELQNDKIYFKFLYTLIGSGTPNLNSCNAEYVTGYVNFGNASYNTTTGNIDITIPPPGTGYGSNHYLPYHICQDMVKKELGGKINPSGNCDPLDGIDDGGSAKAIVSQLVSKMGTIFTPNNLCLSVEPTLSYFKIPLLKAKKGGGLRVKRILMYDADGVDDGQPALYGSEYIYKLENGQSSGVATNEPSTIREENPLINFLPKRTNQTFLQKAISGIDRDQFEGPLGESILPAPSVGYSRIVTKNIHNGKTNTGFVVSEFYTAKDFPFDMIYGDGSATTFNGKAISNTTLDDQTMDKFWLNIPAIYVNISTNNYWASQGYRFVKNEMHGQPKSVSTFGGDYTPGTPNLANKSSSTEYDYFLPGQKIAVMNDDGSTVLKDIGKEVEVVMETRGIEDITEDISTELDVSVGVVNPVVYLPYFTGSGSLSYAERKMFTHVTSKVINFPAIQKSVTQTQDGISHKTENLVFSRFTGKPIQTKSYDGFNDKNLQQSTAHKGVYTSYEVPGYTQYMELGQKAINQNMTFKSNLGSTISPYTITFAASSPSLSFAASPYAAPNSICDALKLLAVGDLIEVTNVSGGAPNYFHVDGASGSGVKLLKSGHYTPSITIPPGALVNFKIIKSGRTNQLNLNVGNYTVYGATGTGIYGTLTTRVFNKRLFIANRINSALTANFASMSVGSTVGVSFGGIPTFVTTGVDSTAVYMYDGSCQGIQNTVLYIKKLSASTFQLQILLGPSGSPYSLCSTDIYTYVSAPSASQFVINTTTGKMQYIQGDLPCSAFSVKCLDFCPTAERTEIVYNVISSSATTMNHIWPYDAAIFDLKNYNTGKNDYETGMKGKWRTSSSYAYKEAIVGGAIEKTTKHERIYASAGTYSMSMFGWKSNAPADSNKWVRTSTVTKYSPNGSAIEEKDASHFYSTAKYGYNLTLPYLVAKNSTYSSVNFESFENMYSPSIGVYRVEENLPVANTNITTAFAHSGKKSYILTTASFIFAKSVLTSQMTSAGVSCKVWVKDPQRTNLPIKGTVVGAASLPLIFNKIAQTGEWSLYEAKVTNWTGLVVGNPIDFYITNNIVSQPTIYIDDIRMQPLNAQVNTYVYDNVSKRLLTSFDDQHFGLYYQYNQEGKLVRKLIETEKGMKTIAETQYNTPKTNR